MPLILSHLHYNADMRVRTLFIVGLPLISFLYLAGCDSAGPSNEELAPIATNDEFSLSQAKSGVDSPGIRENDVDPNKVDTDDGSPNVGNLSVVDPQGVGSEDINVSKDGSFKYTGSDSPDVVEFEYRVVDEGNGKSSNTATVRIEGN